MKKFLILIVLLLLSCQKDELIEVEIPQSYELIFDEVESTILDGQDISFEVSVEGKYLLLITDISLNLKLSLKPVPIDLAKASLAANLFA